MNRSYILKGGRPFVLGIYHLLVNRSSIEKEGYPFVRRIDNLFGNRSSVYLRNYSVDAYKTTFCRSKEIFFSRVFVEIALKGERMRFIYR